MGMGLQEDRMKPESVKDLMGIIPEFGYYWEQMATKL